MKPMIFVPPAQAEALSDTQGDFTQENLRSADFGPRQPWRDEEAADDLLPFERQRRDGAGSNAQLWPSSANNSR